MSVTMARRASIACARELTPSCKAEAVVVVFLVPGQGTLLAFLVRDVGCRMIVLQALVATIGISMGLFRQGRPALAQDAVVNPSGHRIRSADNPARRRDDDFVLDDVAFFLAGVPATLLAARALDRLLRGVNDEGCGFLGADPDRFLDAQHAPSQGLNPLQGVANGGFIDLIQTAQKILRHPAAIQDQQNQNVIFQCANAPRTA